MGDHEVRAGIKSETVKHFAEECHKSGVKVTHQRLEIFREILAARDHPSVEDLHKRLKLRLPSLSLDTVYRTLQTLERFGLVTKLPLAKGPARYEGHRAPHHHCVCAQCNDITDLSWPAADTVALPSETRQWGRVLSRHIQLQGLCAHCLSHTASEKRVSA